MKNYVVNIVKGGIIMKRLISVVISVLFVVSSSAFFVNAQSDISGNETEDFLSTEEILDQYGPYYEEMEQDYLTLQNVQQGSIAHASVVQNNNQDDTVINTAVSKRIEEDDGVVLLVSLFSTTANSGSLDRNYTCTYGRIYQRVGFEEKVNSLGKTVSRLRSVQAKVVSVNTGYTWAKTSIDYGQLAARGASTTWSGTKSSTVLDDMTYIFDRDIWIENSGSGQAQISLFGTYTFKKGTASYNYNADLIYYAI